VSAVTAGIKGHHRILTNSNKGQHWKLKARCASEVLHLWAAISYKASAERKRGWSREGWENFCKEQRDVCNMLANKFGKSISRSFRCLPSLQIAYTHCFPKTA